MLATTKNIGGRGYSIVVWCSGLLMIVELLLIWALFEGSLTGTEFTDITTLFFLMIGGMGGVYQGQNLINAVPGVRKWEGRPHPEAPADK
jgi:hypothetical protein